MTPPWPSVLDPVFQRSITCEVATMSKAGTPITSPLVPYVGAGTIDVSTGLTYPAKAERARRNPKVGILFSDPVGAGLANQPVVLIEGHAAVRDADLQANTDRYVRESSTKSAAMNGIPAAIVRKLDWYFARIYLEVTPLRIRWWQDVDAAPQEWIAPEGTPLPESDPAPAGTQPAAWTTPPADWRKSVKQARGMGNPVVTSVADGMPIPFRASAAWQTDAGFRLLMPKGRPIDPAGPSSLVFHSHPEQFTGQANLTYVGRAATSGDMVEFTVERQLASWSLGGGNPIKAMADFFGPARTLSKRVRHEAERRGQPPPVVKPELLTRSSL